MLLWCILRRLLPFLTRAPLSDSIQPQSHTRHLQSSRAAIFHISPPLHSDPCGNERALTSRPRLYGHLESFCILVNVKWFSTLRIFSQFRSYMFSCNWISPGPSSEGKKNPTAICHIFEQKFMGQMQIWPIYLEKWPLPSNIFFIPLMG